LNKTEENEKMRYNFIKLEKNPPLTKSQIWKKRERRRDAM
jgi:hypothetical protein